MKEFEEVLSKIGILAGVGEDWYEIGEAEYDDVADDNVRYGIYAKSDEIADKVGNVLDKLMADRKTEPTSSKMEQVEDEPQTDCAWGQTE